MSSDISSKDKTAVKRNASYRQRMREQGYVLLQVWCNPEDREAIRQYAESMRNDKKVSKDC